MARRTGRNDDCPCGSGKKYKKCCGALDEVAPDLNMDFEEAGPWDDELDLDEEENLEEDRVLDELARFSREVMGSADPETLQDMKNCAHNIIADDPDFQYLRLEDDQTLAVFEKTKERIAQETESSESRLEETVLEFGPQFCSAEKMDELFEHALEEFGRAEMEHHKGALVLLMQDALASKRGEPESFRNNTLWDALIFQSLSRTYEMIKDATAEASDFYQDATDNQTLRRLGLHEIPAGRPVHAMLKEDEESFNQIMDVMTDMLGRLREAITDGRLKLSMPQEWQKVLWAAREWWTMDQGTPPQPDDPDWIDDLLTGEAWYYVPCPQLAHDVWQAIFAGADQLGPKDGELRQWLRGCHHFGFGAKYGRFERVVVDGLAQALVAWNAQAGTLKKRKSPLFRNPIHPSRWMDAYNQEKACGRAESAAATALAGVTLFNESPEIRAYFSRLAQNA
mgnify:CR=1 FL=1